MNKYEIIILIGGRGKRVNKYTKKIPKCLIEFYGKFRVFNLTEAELIFKINTEGR